MKKISLLAALLCLLLVLSACFKTTPPTPEPPTNTVDSKRERFSEAGGTLTLADGSYITLPQGFLDTSAEVAFYSSTDAPMIKTPGYESSRWQAIGYTYTLELPQAAVSITAENAPIDLMMFVPAFKEHQNVEYGVAEVILEAGEQILTARNYSPTGEREDDEREGIEKATNLFKISNRQLRGGLAEAQTVKIIIRPVIENPSFSAQAVPTGFVLEDVVTGLNLGVGFDFAKDGRIFIAEKRGVVKVFQNDALLATPFADISRQVNSHADRGLLGIAVHPDFPEQPYLYLLFTYEPPQYANYSSGSPGAMDGNGARVARLIRLTADASKGYNVAVPGSELVLLGKNSTFENIADMNVRNGSQSCYKNNAYVQDCLPADETSHTIGTVRFGTDGSLFVGNGDGANFTRVEAYATRALDVNSLAGKIMRINPETGQGYATNPFYNGNLDSNASRVYSLGLRNLFRFTVSEATNEPWIGDVGWGTWEEVNTGRGANFGWPCYEGGNKTNEKAGGYQAITTCQTFYQNPTNLTPSAYGYYRAGVGSSVQVGDFYNGTAYPAEYRGGLFISDFNQQWIKYLTFNTDGSVKAVNNFATGEAGVAQTSAGPDTNLYLMRIYDGKLQRLRYTAAGNNTPVAVAEATPNEGEVPLTVSFNSFGSYDADAQDLTYLWNFGNGVTSNAANPTYTYTTRGVYIVTLRVTDTIGASNTTQLTIKAGSNPPVATIASPADGSFYSVGDLISFSGSGTDTEDGTLSGPNLRWDMRLHHNEHVHFDELPNITGNTGSYRVTDHGDNTYLELCLIATDSSGQSARQCINLYPRTLQVTLNSVPSGLQLGWDGSSRTTPFTVTTIAGSRHTLTALDTQNSLSFRNWSDGGARVHDVTLGATATTFTATYSVATPVCAGLVQEAETGAFFGDFTLGNDANASGGKFVYVPDGRLGAQSPTPLDGQRVDYCFNVTTPGTYRVKANAYASSNAMDTFYMKVDGQPSAGYIWYVGLNTSYRSFYVTDRASTIPITVTLAAGQHTLSFYRRESGVRLDKVALEQVGSSTTTGRLESVTVNTVSSSSWTTVTLRNTYQRMVAVCSIKMQNNTLPEGVRMQNAIGNSFQIRLQNPSGAALAGEQVMCLAAEAGNWRLPDGRAFEAQQTVSIKEDRPYSWNGDRVSYLGSYTTPIVLGQVMTYNDTRWSTFWSHGVGPDPRREPPNTAGIYVGKSIGEDPVLERADETLGFMVFEAGNGSVAGIPYTINIGTQTIWGYTNNPRGGDYTFTPAFSSTPQVAVVTQMGMDGGDGSWALLRGSNSVSNTTLNLLVDEDQLKDPERWAVEHQVGYAVFGSNINLTLSAPPALMAANVARSSILATATVSSKSVSLDVVAVDGQTMIFWSASDVSTLTGFTVFRSSDANFSHATPISKSIPAYEASEYSLVDSSASANDYYWLEFHQVGGNKEVIGPEKR